MELVYKEDTQEKVERSNYKGKNIPMQYRRLRGNIIETYKLMTEIYHHEIVDYMPKQHESSSSPPTQCHHLKLYRQRAEKNLRNNFLKSQATGTVSQTMLFKHQTPRHLKADWTNTGWSMKENTTSEAITALLLIEDKNMHKLMWRAVEEPEI